MDVEQEQQAALVTFLGDRRSWGAPAVEQVQTHAARIFLVGDRAYKLKRAVRYSFLDFSTPERRRDALQAELRLNRRTAPMLYRHVLPVTRRQDGGFEIDGRGEPVDWLLEMRRFDQAAGLDRIAAAGPLDGRLVDELAEAVVELHEQAEVDRTSDGHRAMAEVIGGNASDLAGLAGCHFPVAPVRRLNEATAAELARRRPLLEARGRAGRIRHGHGDLHLANIVVLDGRPVLFDCLEFDPALARTDVLYDLAFLIMDLLHRGQRHPAQRLLSVYLERTEDDAG
ncbi:MAG TPA: phosphotransferase, partial [Geminicoccaceae bacterium]